MHCMNIQTLRAETWKFRKFRTTSQEFHKCHWESISADERAQLHPRARHTACAFKGSILCFGGLGSADRPYLDAVRLNPSSCSWTDFPCVGDVPVDLSCTAATEYGDSIWLFGGIDRTTGLSVNTTYRLNVERNQWQIASPRGDMPRSRNSHTFVTCGGNMFAFGGWDEGVFFDDLYVLHSHGREWLQMAQSPVRPCPRMGHSAAVFRNSMFVFGGFAHPNTLADLWEYNIALSRWNRVDAAGRPPNDRYRHTAVVVADAMIVYGGISAGKQRFNDLFVFELTRKLWVQVDQLPGVPEPRSFHQAVALDGAMYVFGGVGRHGKLGDTSRLVTASFVVDSVGALPSVVTETVKERTPEPEEGRAAIQRLERRITELEAKVTCKVCMEKEINCVLIPCAHRCVCLGCASVIVHGDCVCPICRESILRLVETIDA